MLVGFKISVRSLERNMIGYDESWRLERGFDYTVGLQDTEDDVEEPQEHENEGRDPF